MIIKEKRSISEITLFIMDKITDLISCLFNLVCDLFFHGLILVVLAGFAVLALGLIYAVPMYRAYDEYGYCVAMNSVPEDFALTESSTIYSRTGNPLATLALDSDLTYTDYDAIPDTVKQAFIAIEDRTFWTNEGVDYRGIVRVILDYLATRGGEEHGASTITQQLVRAKYLSNEVSIERKVKEICISRYISKKYSKQQILEFYVNNACFGNNIYGIAGAAKAYFDTDLADLSLSQVAYLCALPNRPTYYNPYKNPERALERRDKILNDMVECGFISVSDKIAAEEERINISRPKYQYNNYESTFATDCAIKYLMKYNGFEFRYKFDSDEDAVQYSSKYLKAYDKAKKELYTGGYSIYTSLDHGCYETLQGILDDEMSFNTEKDEKTGLYKLQGALACIDNHTGKVIAVVGGRTQDYAEILGNSQVYTFNRAYQAFRQPGSSIKPLSVYTPALMKGYEPDTIVENIDVSEAKVDTQNIKEMHGPALELREAVEKSLNGVAVKVYDDITPEYGMSFLEKMHYEKLCKDDYYISGALGGYTNGVSPVEQASGYATLENDGLYRGKTCITSIINRAGEEIYKDPDPEQIYDSDAAKTMKDILQGVITKGTASQMKWYDSSEEEAFGKTGTTNASKDGWFCGATDDYTIAVWVGYDQPEELEGLYGATYPAEIWKRGMLAMLSE